MRRQIEKKTRRKKTKREIMGAVKNRTLSMSLRLFGQVAKATP